MEKRKKEGERREGGEEAGREETGRQMGGWMVGQIVGVIHLYIPWKMIHVLLNHCFHPVYDNYQRVHLRIYDWNKKINCRYNTKQIQEEWNPDSISTYWVCGIHHQNCYIRSSSINRSAAVWIQSVPPEGCMLQPWSLADGAARSGKISKRRV